MTNLQLYASLENPASIHEMISEVLQDLIMETVDDKIVIFKKTLFKKKKICTISYSARKVGEVANVFLKGFAGYLNAELKGDESLRQRILYQVMNANITMEIDVETKEVEAFWGYLILLNDRMNGLIYMPSGYILTVNGEELVDPEGQILVANYTPEIHKEQAELQTFVNATEANKNRRKATFAKLDERQIPYVKYLPLLPDEAQLQLKTTEEIARRAAVLLIIIQFVREVLDDKERANMKASKRIAEVFLNRFGVKMNLTEQEKAFFEQDVFQEQQLINRMWHYESAWTLLWTIGLIDELPEPENICDVEAVLTLLTSYTNIGELLVDVKPRDAGQLLDRMDENYIYHWACIDQRIKGENPPANLDEGIVMERQRAFNWMTNLRAEEWDDITLNY